MDLQEATSTYVMDTKPVKMPLWAPRFLKAFASCGVVTKACKAAKIVRQTHYDAMKENPLYRAAFEATEERVGDMLEDLAVERVCEGRLVLYQGEPVEVNGGFLREYDTPLHITLLKRFKPAAYREHASLEVSGTINLAERMKAAEQRLLAMKRDTGTTG